MSKKILLSLLIAGFIFIPRPLFAKSFFQNLLESQIGGSSSGSGNGSASQELQDRSQTLREDEQRLDEAYSRLRQAQAAGGDTTAEMENVRHMEQAYTDRKQQVRQLQYQARQQAQYQQMNQARANQQQLDEAYYQLRQKQAAGLDTTREQQNIRYLEQQQANGGQYNNDPFASNRRSSFGNSSWNNNSYDDQYGSQNDDSNDGFKIRFGG